MGEREGAAEPMLGRRTARRGTVTWRPAPPRAHHCLGREGEREEGEGETEVRGRRGRVVEVVEEEKGGRRRPAHVRERRGEREREREKRREEGTRS